MNSHEMEYFARTVDALLAYRRFVGHDVTFDDFVKHLKTYFKRDLVRASGDGCEEATGLCADIGFWEFDDVVA